MYHVRVRARDLDGGDDFGVLELLAVDAHLVVPLGDFGSQLGAVMEHDARVQLARHGESLRVFHEALREEGHELPVGRVLTDPLDGGEDRSLVGGSHLRPEADVLRARGGDVMHDAAGDRRHSRCSRGFLPHRGGHAAHGGGRAAHGGGDPRRGGGRGPTARRDQAAQAAAHGDHAARDARVLQKLSPADRSLDNALVFGFPRFICHRIALPNLR